MIFDYIFLDIVSMTLDVLGKIMIAFTAIMVHHRFRQEHKVDDIVFRAMRREQVVGVLGIIFILAGYVIELVLRF